MGEGVCFVLGHDQRGEYASNSNPGMLLYYLANREYFTQASQIAVATLGLTYNINSADKVAVTAPGTVAVPDMTNIQTGKVLSSNSQAISALRYTANK